METSHENGSRYVNAESTDIRPPKLDYVIKRVYFFLVVVAVIQSLIALVNDPEPEHPLRGDLAEEFLKDHKKFLKNAEEYTRKYGEKRPSEY